MRADHDARFTAARSVMDRPEIGGVGLAPLYGGKQWLGDPISGRIRRVIGKGNVGIGVVALRHATHTDGCGAVRFGVEEVTMRRRKRRAGRSFPPRLRVVIGGPAPARR